MILLWDVIMRKPVLFLALLVPILSYAALGGNPPLLKELKTKKQFTANVSSSNLTDSRVVKANYVTYTSIDGACQIKQFATLETSANGSKVFAVLWHCPITPNLKELLTDEYFTILRTTQPQINTLNYKKYVTSNVVIELSGHQGDSRGNAYLIKQIPNNVNIKELLNNEKI